MLEKNNSLKERCKIATQEDGDTFVGIKVDVDETLVYFPLGFEIAETDFEIRHDILNLLTILRELVLSNLVIILSLGMYKAIGIQQQNRLLISQVYLMKLQEL